MSRGLSSSQGSVAPNSVSSHLVVKRGHHGRYRFVMIDNGEKIGGEVRVNVADSGSEGSRARALAKIARLAEALLAGITTRLAVDGHVRSDDVMDLRDVDARYPRLHTIIGEGDRRGQV